jgi:hypothetical protein
VVDIFQNYFIGSSLKDAEWNIKQSCLKHFSCVGSSTTAHGPANPEMQAGHGAVHSAILHNFAELQLHDLTRSWLNFLRPGDFGLHSAKLLPIDFAASIALA